MRKIITTLLALTALAAVAQPAMAAVPEGDDGAAQYSDVWDYGNGKMQDCQTLNKDGIQGQYGAWGNYISGCTVKLDCPATKTSCIAAAESRIYTEGYIGDKVTLNSRTRMFGAGETTTGRWRDYSCADTNWCRAEDRVEIKGGESASVQCNGVRATTDNRARVSCSLDLQYQ